jgi:hypothetical protein
MATKDTSKVQAAQRRKNKGNRLVRCFSCPAEVECRLLPTDGLAIAQDPYKYADMNMLIKLNTLETTQKP